MPNQDFCPASQTCSKSKQPPPSQQYNSGAERDEKKGFTHLSYLQLVRAENALFSFLCVNYLPAQGNQRATGSSPCLAEPVA